MSIIIPAQEGFTVIGLQNITTQSLDKSTRNHPQNIEKTQINQL